LNSKISDKDKKDWEDFLSKNENLPDKDTYPQKKYIEKITTFDLHGYSLNEANKKINPIQVIGIGLTNTLPKCKIGP